MKKNWKPEDEDLRRFLEANPSVPDELRTHLSDPSWWEAVARGINGLPEISELEREFAKMSAWLIENPGRAPRTVRGAKAFVRTWLTKEFG